MIGRAGQVGEDLRKTSGRTINEHQPAACRLKGAGNGDSQISGCASDHDYAIGKVEFHNPPEKCRANFPVCPWLCERPLTTTQANWKFALQRRIAAWLFVLLCYKIAAAFGRSHCAGPQREPKAYIQQRVRARNLTYRRRRCKSLQTRL